MLIKIEWAYGKGATAYHTDCDCTTLTEREASAMLPIWSNELFYRSFPDSNGRTYIPLTDAEKRARAAQQKRNAARRERTANGLTELHGRSQKFNRGHA